MQPRMLFHLFKHFVSATRAPAVLYGGLLFARNREVRAFAQSTAGQASSRTRYVASFPNLV